MPKKGQKRDLPKGLRAVLADNLVALLDRGITIAEIERLSGVDHGTISRIKAQKIATNLDTLLAIAVGLDMDPWVLLMKGGVKSMGQIFTTPAADEKLGAGWTRPDKRQPLLQSGTVKSSTKSVKIKSRTS